MDAAAEMLSIALMLPYVGWGVYTLRSRFRYHDELPVAYEAATLLGLALFYVLEIQLLRAYLSNDTILYIFSLLGLFVSGLALYGHVAVSLTSRVLVDLVMEADRSPSDIPRLGPAEALERQGDYEDALQEYLVVARMFPNNVQVLTRIGECLLRLERPREAAQWYARAFKHATKSSRALSIAIRLSEIQQQHLETPDAARATLAAYLKRFPDTADKTAVEERLKGLSGDAPAAPLPPQNLDALAANPLKAAQAEDETPTTRAAPGPGLAALDEAPLVADGVAGAQEDAPAPTPANAAGSLEALDEHPLEAAPEAEDAVDSDTAEDRYSSELRPLQDEPLMDEDPPPSPPRR